MCLSFALLEVGMKLLPLRSTSEDYSLAHCSESINCYISLANTDRLGPAHPALETSPRTASGNP